MSKQEFSASERALYARLATILLKDAEVLVDKGRSYGDSWKQRGGIGAFMMLARKWDRIENAVKKIGYDVFAAHEKDSRDEGIMDDIRDLRRYLALVEDHLTRDVFNEMAPVKKGGPEVGTVPAAVTGGSVTAPKGHVVTYTDSPTSLADLLKDLPAEEQQDHANSIKMEVLQERAVPVEGRTLCGYCLGTGHLECDCPEISVPL